MSDAKKAALNLYPHDWFDSEHLNGVRFDNNASIRAVAEKIFAHTFEILTSADVADGVAKAFLRRAARCGTTDNEMNAANMSTALMHAVIHIRDGKSEAQKVNISPDFDGTRDAQGG